MPRPQASPTAFAPNLPAPVWVRVSTVATVAKSSSSAPLVECAHPPTAALPSRRVSPPPHPPASPRCPLQEPSRFTGSYVHDRFPDASDCSMAVAFKGASWTDPDSIPLMVMQTMLGERRGSRAAGTRTALPPMPLPAPH